MTKSSNKPPNFIVIVADDLGFTDLSAFGGEINTPNLNKLAQNGLRFTDFHTASACSPTRSMLLSGTDNHIAGLGQMAEFARDFPEKFGGKPGYEGYLNFKVAALPEILQDSNYYNFISGKWHLGMLEEYWPSKRGFENAFSLLPGAGNHYKYFPTGKDGEFRTFMRPTFEENGKLINPLKDLPDDYYSTNHFTDKFIEYLNSDVRGDRPFFGFLTYTAPHWPLQAPKEIVEKYKGFYDDGPGKLRSRRIEAAKKLGIVKEGVEPHEIQTQREKRWSELSEEEKKIEARIMETYAAMVEVMDTNIGRVIAELEKKDELDNTLILFMSDNGAEGMMMEALPVKRENFTNAIESDYNNSIENIGNGDSFVWYSDEWAQAATAPHYMYKMWAAEGGIRCPLIAHFPESIKNKGNIQNGFLTVMDIVPTILDFAGIKHPGTSFRGRKVNEVRGKSWVKYLKGESEYVHDEDTVTGWELFAQQAIRKGKYKALYIPKPLGPDRWQLFDLEADVGETTDLSQEYPEKLKELVDHWAEYVAETGLVECSDEFYNYYNAVYEPKSIRDL